MTERHQFEIVVVGAGATGAAAAAMLAETGRKVALCDARPAADCGARWVNGVPLWMFDAARVARPTGAEMVDAAPTFSLIDVDGSRPVSVQAGGPPAVDMRHLVRRMHRLAKDSGVTLFDQIRIGELHLREGRPRHLTVRRGGRLLRLEAALFVDATGLNGAIRRRVPALATWCPKVPLQHLCTAAQAVHSVEDIDGARRFLDRHGAVTGEVLSQAGVAGGWSVSNVCVGHRFQTVELLAGAIASRGPNLGPELLDASSARTWIGPRRFGGSGLIPLRRPYDRIVAPGVALIGDAACQVFPAHGSGVGLGLIAARCLSDALLRAGDPGSERSLWPYAVQYHRKWGALSAGYDQLRRLTQGLRPSEISRLLSCGLIDGPGTRAALDQRLPKPALKEGLELARAAVREPRLAARLTRGMAVVPRTLALYRRFPAKPSAAALARWSEAVARLFHEAPDRP